MVAQQPVTGYSVMIKGEMAEHKCPDGGKKINSII